METSVLLIIVWALKYVSQEEYCNIKRDTQRNKSDYSAKIYRIDK